MQIARSRSASNGMNQKFKNYLGVAIIATLVVFSVSLATTVYVYYQAVRPTSFRSFSVSGEGKITAAPDLAEFTFGVITEGGNNLADLQSQNTAAANKAIAFVKQSGVADKDVKTQNYNVEPRYQYSTCPRDGGVCPPPKIVGYTVTQTVLVKVRDFTKAGTLLGGVVQNGANTVSQLSFTIEDPTAVENAARNEAIKKAKEKAEGMAAAGGFRLGKLLFIAEQNPVSFPRILGINAESAKNGGAPAPTIEPGNQEVTITVSLNYEIK